MEWSRGVPITVVTLARPELLDRRPGLGRREALVHVDLPRAAARPPRWSGCSPASCRASRPKAVASIVARADGVPLYAVETVRMLLAQGRLVLEGGAYRPVGTLDDVAVPETLTALIAARLDGLDPADRELVADAAVLGQSFSLAGPRGGLRHARGRAGAAAARPRPTRAARPRRRSPLARARPVRLRPGAHPRGRLQHALAAGTARSATSRRRATSRTSARTSSRAGSPGTTSRRSGWPRTRRRRMRSRRRPGSRSGPRPSGRPRSARTSRRSRSSSRRSRSPTDPAERARLHTSIVAAARQGLDAALVAAPRGGGRDRAAADRGSRGDRHRDRRSRAGPSGSSCRTRPGALAIADGGVGGVLGPGADAGRRRADERHRGVASRSQRHRPGRDGLDGPIPADRRATRAPRGDDRAG